jgi:subtilisin family serine protease
MTGTAVLDAPPAEVMPLLTSNVAVQMDPRLQHLAATRKQGNLIEAGASTTVDEVAVIALVKDPQAWEELSEVRVGTAIGPAGDQRGAWIVTGRIPATRIEAVRTSPVVLSLKAGQTLQPLLAAGLEETGARPDLLPQGNLSNGGKDVVVGIVDYGCDFAHRNFVGAGGKTRLLSIWHQGGKTSPSSPFGYGREYSAAEIDAARTQANPYAALGYGPAPDTPTSKGSHGTHVMDIAAGNGNGSGVPGFAPQADLVFVDVSHSDLDWSGPDVVESSFGDSIQLLEAVQYILEKAGTRPCVINISLGTNGGPHDGRSLVEQGIDRLLAAAPNRAITIAASNSFDDGIHASGTVPAGGAVELVWQVPPGKMSHKELELWYDGADRFDVEIFGPDGKSLGMVPAGASASSSGGAGNTELFVANRLGDPNNGDNVIGLFLDRTAPAGDWKVRLSGKQVLQGRFHAWIERDNQDQSNFAPPHDSSHTIGSISCGQLSIVVGSYDAHKSGRPISYFSSAGPTRDGREKPEISAPGHAVLAAHSRTTNGVVSKNGTSMAAPAVAGIIALMMGEARARAIDLPIADVRQILITAARRAPPAGSGWHDRYGAGRIDAAGAVAAVSARASPPVPAPAARPPRQAASKRPPHGGKGKPPNRADKTSGRKPRKQ